MHTGKETACCVIFNVRDRYEQQSQKVATCKKKSTLVRWEQTCRLFIAARVDSALGLCKGSMYSSKTDLKTVRGFRDNRAAKSKVLFSWSPRSLKMNALCTRVSVKTVTKQRAYIWLAWHVVGGGKLFPGLQRACAPTWNICHTDGRDGRNKTWSAAADPGL